MLDNACFYLENTTTQSSTDKKPKSMLEQLVHFIANHWLLSSALVIVLILLLLEEKKSKAGGNRLSPQDATTLINRERAVVIDLRDTAAYEGGHVVNALNFPESNILNNLAKLKKYLEKPVILMDAAGNHAGTTGYKLEKQGFKKIYCLAGGIHAWTKAGLPLTKKNK